MHGVTWTPGGSVQPPTSYGASVLRATIESTGRTRRTSLTDGVEVLVVARAHAREHVGVAREPLERPGERAGGRLVAGGQQRHELVAHLLARRRRAVLVAGGAQHGEDGPVVGLGVDPLVDQRVEPLPPRA